MQVHSGMSGSKGDRVRTYKVCKWSAFSVIVVAILAILVTAFILSPHLAAGNSPIDQICYHKGAHLCFFPIK